MGRFRVRFGPPFVSLLREGTAIDGRLVASFICHHGIHKAGVDLNNRLNSGGVLKQGILITVYNLHSIEATLLQNAQMSASSMASQTESLASGHGGACRHAGGGRAWRWRSRVPTLRGFASNCLHSNAHELGFSESDGARSKE